MAKLTDMQAVLLSTAAQRVDGNLLPPPESLGAISDRTRKAIDSLIKRSLAAEVEVGTAATAWRSEGEQHWSVLITDGGRAAIGIDREFGTDQESTPTTAATYPPASGSARPTKTALVLGMLRREEGATLEELVAATGWLPHTTRAALTGLRKKGHSLAKGKRDEVTCYTAATAA